MKSAPNRAPILLKTIRPVATSSDQYNDRLSGVDAHLICNCCGQHPDEHDHHHGQGWYSDMLWITFCILASEASRMLLPYISARSSSLSIPYDESVLVAVLDSSLTISALLTAASGPYCRLASGLGRLPIHPAVAPTLLPAGAAWSSLSLPPPGIPLHEAASLAICLAIASLECKVGQWLLDDIWTSCLCL